MKVKHILSFVMSTILFISCGTGTGTDTGAVSSKTDTVKKAVATELVGCYTMHIAKDTARLQISSYDKTVKGTLSYKRFEKDSNDGTIEGVILDDKIKAWYNFKSEGMMSVREVYFKIINDKLVEGYGDMEQRSDTAYFKFPTTLRYEETHPYIKVSCQ